MTAEASVGDRIYGDGAAYTRCRHTAAASASRHPLLRRAPLRLHDTDAQRHGSKAGAVWVRRNPQTIPVSDRQDRVLPPKFRRFTEACLNRFTFDEYILRLPSEEKESFQLAVGAMKMLLLRTMAPERVAGLGGRMECRCCG